MFAQSFEKGNVIITAGYGFGNLSKALFKTYSNNTGYKSSSIGPAFGKVEFAVSDKVGIGLNFAHIGVDANYKMDDNYEGNINFKNTSVLGRINLHFANSEKFDAYWGAGLGYRFGGWKHTDNDPNTVSDGEIPTMIPFGFETTVGVRYFFIKNLGVYAELGIAKAPIQFGLSAKF
ncbi:outer membrane beta-barrel protein [Rhodocytophaga rosea]|uniref:Outer membrane beta-barrel protein n=1 Tax=Rhodocytophaga rosea TaxID=2704465 RepID=A0A6C0GEH5_9BACT|nr:outer membrane beta-barrel protein [Rhodocytophaga rosea]